jgi:hypothetical protein
MASAREQVLQALEALVRAALPGADVARSRTATVRLGPGGAVTLFDGDPGEPEIDLSPLTYNYAHTIPLAFAAGDATSVDAMQRAVGAAVEADRSLGGLCQFLETTAPDGEALDVAGAESAAQSSAAIVAHYSTRSPL